MMFDSYKMHKINLLLIFYYILIQGMVLNYEFSHLHYLFQKLLRYYHNKQNYTNNLKEGVTSSSLKINKDPRFAPAEQAFKNKLIFLEINAEVSLFVFLFTKSDKVIAKPITEVYNLAITEKQQVYYKNLTMK